MNARVITKLHECSLKNCPLRGRIKVQISYEDGEIDYPILYADGHISCDYPERLTESIITRLVERFAFAEKQNQNSKLKEEEV